MVAKCANGNSLETFTSARRAGTAPFLVPCGRWAVTRGGVGGQPVWLAGGLS